MKIDLNHILQTETILLFDGPCNLCNNGVQFTLKHDKKGLIKFASLQSEVGQLLLTHFNLPLSDHSSLVLVEKDRYWTKSTAILEIGKRMGGVFRLGIIGYIIPQVIRDFTYSIIAKNRYSWFGKSQQCFLPHPKFKNRFID